jgi:membrane protease YdiL (CAAX protease family)
MRKLCPELSALVELGLLFIPSIPAFVWLWPGISGTGFSDLVQSLVYVYVLCGTLFIGLRHWTWGQLGLNRRGIVLSLVCGAILIAERVLVAPLALGLPLSLRPFVLGRVVGEIVFYFGLVEVVEELLFRGLVYQILDRWRGPGLAILGSALGFALWHIGWMGPLILGPFLIGIVFGLVRWRAGGIVGLILVHGIFDLASVEMPMPASLRGIDQVLQIRIVNPFAVVVGDALLDQSDPDKLDSAS